MGAVEIFGIGGGAEITMAFDRAGSGQRFCNEESVRRQPSDQEPIAVAPTVEKDACFVAGTPVWTDKGLVPIEQIKVGDLVLFKPEDDDNGPPEYKRVVNTSSREGDVTFLEACRDHPEKEAWLKFTAVVVTNEHPFWVKRWESEGWGWHPVNQLAGRLRLQHGGECEVSTVTTAPASTT